MRGMEDEKAGKRGFVKNSNGERMEKGRRRRDEANKKNETRRTQGTREDGEGERMRKDGKAPFTLKATVLGKVARTNTLTALAA